MRHRSGLRGFDAGKKVTGRKRFIVVDTLGRYRRLVRDFEATVASSLAWIGIALIRLLIQRLGEAGGESGPRVQRCA